MLTDLLRRLAGEPSPQPLHPDDARLAMAALMVRVARTDGNYTENERNRIDRVLAETYGL
ncbi:MAG: TerB family tellurite resistance protein, partial [Rhodobacteraceae bacterium]|nr:TerB family tellurite resistance protein [Paracoccaceae bacterium]